MHPGAHRRHPRAAAALLCASFYARARRLASALAKRGIKRGDTVSVMLANTPAMVEAHYGVPMTQGVLNTLNTRLDARDHRRSRSTTPTTKVRDHRPRVFQSHEGGAGALRK